MDIKFLIKTKHFKQALDILDRAEVLNFELLYILEKILEERNIEGFEIEIREWIKDLVSMSPLLAHIRFIDINRSLTRLGLLLYWWHCKKVGVKPFIYTDAEYMRLLDKKKIDFLKQQAWGEKLKETWEIILRVEEDGQQKTILVTSLVEPTEQLIKNTLPANLKLISILRITKK